MCSCPAMGFGALRRRGRLTEGVLLLCYGLGVLRRRGRPAEGVLLLCYGRGTLVKVNFESYGRVFLRSQEAFSYSIVP